MENKIFNVCDTKNYNSNFDKSSVDETSKKILLLLSNFVDYINEQEKNINNKEYNSFIIKRGFETIKHCFEILLLYTKNPNLALFNSKKAYVYYVEFIGQIGYNNHSFLKLNSIDATIFVYKKTIFEIDNGIRKKYIEDEDEKKYFSFISHSINIYILLYTILDSKTEQDDKKQEVYLISNKCYKILSNIFNKDCDIEKNIENIENIYFFINYLNENCTINRLFFTDIVNCFIKKIKKKQICKNKLNDKLNNKTHIQTYITEQNNIKLIKYLFTN